MIEVSSARSDLALFRADGVLRPAAIRHLASYYAAILNESTHKRQRTSAGSSSRGAGERITVTLVTDDADNKRKAIAGGIAALSVREYVETQATEVSSILMDLLAAVGTGPEKRRGAALYPEVSLACLGPRIVADSRPPWQYLAPSVLQAGIKAGKLLQGHFNPNQYNYKEVRSNVSLYSTSTDPQTVP
jgi:exosome complex exonuclease DIS3/RRP44